MQKKPNIPVITIDGPSGSGKGTIAQLLAKALGWHYLDSGALYRVFAWVVLRDHIDPTDETALQRALDKLHVTMREEKIFLDDHAVTEDIRSEACSQMASITSAIPLVRKGLLAYQKNSRQLPGLVTDGRDMGTVVFPDAAVKFYFEASALLRAKRRYNQLKEKGKHVNLPDIQRELETRDARDESRAISPTKPAEDAILIDTTDLTIEEVLQLVLKKVHQQLS